MSLPSLESLRVKSICVCVILIAMKHTWCWRDKASMKHMERKQDGGNGGVSSPENVDFDVYMWRAEWLWTDCCFLPLLVSVWSHSVFLGFFWPCRDNGTLQGRPPTSSFPRSPSSDVPWRGSSQAPCSCPGCPADRPRRTDPRTVPSPAPQFAASSPPGAWGLWPAASPKPCESVLLSACCQHLSAGKPLFGETLH